MEALLIKFLGESLVCRTGTAVGSSFSTEGWAHCHLPYLLLRKIYRKEVKSYFPAIYTVRARAQLLTGNTHVQIIGCTPQGSKQMGTIPKIWILKGTIKPDSYYIVDIYWAYSSGQMWKDPKLILWNRIGLLKR